MASIEQQISCQIQIPSSSSSSSSAPPSSASNSSSPSPAPSINLPLEIDDDQERQQALMQAGMNAPGIIRSTSSTDTLDVVLDCTGASKASAAVITSVIGAAPTPPFLSPSKHTMNIDLQNSHQADKHDQRKGSWLHAGYHLTSGTTGPQILSLPFAIAALGWGPGLFILCLGGAVSFYSYYLQIKTVEHVTASLKHTTITATTATASPHHHPPTTCHRFRDLSAHVIGEKWTAYAIAPLQFVVCFATVVSCIVLGGQTLKAIFQGQDLSLYQFTIVFGCAHMILSQLPSLHSLRHLNLIALMAYVAYSSLIVCGSILAGVSGYIPKKDYNITGTMAQQIFGVFNALSILSNVYGNVIVVEIQAAIKPPTSKNMVKGLYLCYVVILITIIPIAISGYWAFGASCNGNILFNIFPIEGQKYAPTWLSILVNMFLLVQLVVSSLMYSHPTFAVLEEPITNSSKNVYASRNIIPRLMSRSIFTVFATLFAAMLPYFESINALIGALGYTPLVFVIPIVFYLRKMDYLIVGCTRRWMNYTMVAVFSLITVLGCLASFRQLILNARMYHLFPNL